MTAPVYACDATEARTLTEQIKGSVEKTYRLLLNAHEWRAWSALGYGSWRDYAMAEFGVSQSYAYRLLDAAKVVREIEAAAGSPIGELTEGVARDLKPHLAEVSEAVREAVADVPEPERPAVAAAAVRDARERLRPAAPVRDTPPEPEVLPAEQWEQQNPPDQPHPLAAARAEAARHPSIVTGEAMKHLERARRALLTAGTPTEILADHDTDSIDTTGDWLYELDASIAVLTPLAAALRRRNIRSVK